MAVFFRPSVFRLGGNSRTALKRFCSGTNVANKRALILGVHSADGCVKLTKPAFEFSNKTSGKLAELLHAATGSEMKEGKNVIFYGLDEYHSVTLVSLGKECKVKDDLEMLDPYKESVRKAAAIGCKAAIAQGATHIDVSDLGDARAAAEGSILSSYKYQEYKTKKDTEPKISTFNIIGKCKDDWDTGAKMAEAQNFARTLMNTPPNLMTPTIFSDTVKKTLEPLGVQIKVYDEKWAKEKGMNSFLSVSQGSEEPPKFLEITYGKSKEEPFVLVGKGVTFDSGGISLKPAANMHHMSGDMGGAATVVGTILGLANLKVPVNIVGLIPLTENMPSGKATKPGDVFQAMNGKYICVENTDAEGRLILADALCYSASFCPKWVIDVATLTGAMSVALGNGATGVFSNSNKLYRTLEEAACTTGDRVWRFPLWKHYTKQISDYPAFDLNNIAKAGTGGGAATAAAFLKEFVPEKTDWMHLDIAGVMGPGDKIPYIGATGFTGRPTRTLIEFIKRQTSTK